MSAALAAPVAAPPVSRPRIAPPSPRAVAERAMGEAVLRLAAERHRLAVARERVAAGVLPEAAAIECEHRHVAAILAASLARVALGMLVRSEGWP